MLNYIGGKSQSAEKLVRLMPEHDCYVEVFGGGLWTFFRKEPSKIEVVNDINGELINFYRVIQRKSDEFIKREKYELYSAELYYEYLIDYKIKKMYKEGIDLEKIALKVRKNIHYVSKIINTEFTDVERAFRFFCLIKEAFASKFGSGWGYGAVRNNASIFFNEFKIIDDISKRLKRVQIDNRDFEDVIKGYDNEKVVFYCCLPKTKIRMRNEEMKNIEDIKIGDNVFSGGKVLNIIKREYSGNIYELEIMGIYDKLCVTEEHLIAIISKNILYLIKDDKQSKFKSQFDLNMMNYEFISVKNIKEGDFVIIPCYPENIMQTSYVDIGGVEILCDDYLGWVCGLWLAEGHINNYYKDITRNYLKDIKNGKQRLLDDNIGDLYIDNLYKKNEYESSYSITYSLGEKDIENGIVKSLDKWYYKNFGITGKIHQNSEKSYPVFYFNENMARFLHEKFGRYALNKIISLDFMNYDFHFQRGLLRGWLDGDGGIWRGENNKVKLTGTTISKNLALDMYLISLRIGLRPSLKTRKGLHNLIYDVYFSNIYDIKYLYPERYFPSKYDRSKRRIITKNDKKYIISPITKIENKNYKGEVYNLTTENNTYIANYILNHNCDPPYSNISLLDNKDYYFESVDAKFTLYDHQRLYNCLKSLKGKFILTYDNTPWVRERYCNGDFTVLENEVFYCSADKNNRRHEVELIIMNYNIEKERKHVDVKQNKLDL